MLSATLVRSLRPVHLHWPWLAALLLLAACGGVAASSLVETRPDAEAMLPSIRDEAEARGFRVRYREGRSVRFVLDAESRTTVSFRSGRRGLMMVVRTRDGETVPVEEQRAWLARAEEAGHAVLDDARVRFADAEHARVLAEAAAREREAQAAREREVQEAERRASAPAEPSPALQAFMARHQARREARQQAQQPQAPSEPTRGDGSSMHCCINGAYYACPDGGAVHRCSGAFMSCVSGGGGMQECLSSDPPDPSRCDRDPSRDGEC